MDQDGLNEARDRTIATVARRLAKTTQLDFNDALIDAQTAVWLVERRPRMDPERYGFKGVADQAYLAALDQIQRDEGYVQGTDGSRRRPTSQWPIDFDLDDDRPAPDDYSEWAEALADFMDQVRDAIRRVDPSAIWVVDAVENGYRLVGELLEWRIFLGFDIDRREAKRAYDLFHRYSRKVLERMAEREGDDF